jgi:hypothetical protein
MKHLIKQGDTYLVRLSVAEPLRAIIGKRELIESTGTGDPKES